MNLQSELGLVGRKAHLCSTWHQRGQVNCRLEGPLPRWCPHMASKLDPVVSWELRVGGLLEGWARKYGSCSHGLASMWHDG